ncbi:MAG: hypothetical protein RLZZ618_2469 [Pseudomonadota bacterium]
MTLPILYTFRRCPYAMRARLGLLHAELPVVCREITLRDKPPQLLAMSPKGTVPVMLLPDGRVLEESLDILRWALGQNDPLAVLQVGDASDIHDLIDRNDGPFKQQLDRYKYPERHPDIPAELTRGEAVDRHLGPLNDRLALSTQLCGERVSVADLALMPFVRQFAQVDADWFAQSGLAHLKRWLDAWTSSPMFEAAMGKLPVWHEGDAPLVFPPPPHVEQF